MVPPSPPRSTESEARWATTSVAAFALLFGSRSRRDRRARTVIGRPVAPGPVLDDDREGRVGLVDQPAPAVAALARALKRDEQCQGGAQLHGRRDVRGAALVVGGPRRVVGLDDPGHGERARGVADEDRRVAAVSGSLTRRAPGADTVHRRGRYPSRPASGDAELVRRVGGAPARRIGDLQTRPGRRRARSGSSYAWQCERADAESQDGRREAQSTDPLSPTTQGLSRRRA